ncbi:ADP-ribosylglycohydrolase family protein [Kordia algicida OT-1]|uniref:ADP-ribosylglycohydrolase n=1 Tax=Kordia algicida OT-1 TaxID=391587 RepID=A9DQZ0_9FLAO|nr:ADP-ribosylglycohydrolase family protein [Kordia algicida]EDP96716.1 ADP-ribosylglycohydrolase [Kordia algicida OT-1]
MIENTFINRFKGSILLGAIGDAWGSAYENQSLPDEKAFYLFKEPEKPKIWQFTDDTQLTLATCEAILEDPTVAPKTLITYFLKYYNKNRINGIGAATLKALQELNAGAHWSQTGRKGEFSAGNGSAMRIAPLAFLNNISRERIREISYITHQNEEAYVGALVVVLAIKEIINNNWNDTSLIKHIIPKLPDTNVKDRLIALHELENTSIIDVGKLGNNGYVVNSIPLAIFAAQKVKTQSITSIFEELITVGGDTDTNCSIAGQIMGTYVGIDKIPKILKDNIKPLSGYNNLQNIINKLPNTN